MRNPGTEEEPLFVGIPNPQSVRKELLTSVKAVINDLQRYEQLTEPKKDKIKYVLELRRVMQEISVLNRKIKELMPSTAKKPRPGEAAPVRYAAPAPSRKEIDVSRLEQERGKLRALEAQLAKVEEKLDQI
jgi:hypothetical protein